MLSRSALSGFFPALMACASAPANPTVAESSQLPNTSKAPVVCARCCPRPEAGPRAATPVASWDPHTGRVVVRFSDPVALPSGFAPSDFRLSAVETSPTSPSAAALGAHGSTQGLPQTVYPVEYYEPAEFFGEVMPGETATPAQFDSAKPIDTNTIELSGGPRLKLNCGEIEEFLGSGGRRLRLHYRPGDAPVQTPPGVSLPPIGPDWVGPGVLEMGSTQDDAVGQLDGLIPVDCGARPERVALPRAASTAPAAAISEPAFEDARSGAPCACCGGPDTDHEPPIVERAELLSSSSVRLTFSEPIVLDRVDPTWFRLSLVEREIDGDRVELRVIDPCLALQGCPDRTLRVLGLSTGGPRQIDLLLSADISPGLFDSVSDADPPALAVHYRPRAAGQVVDRSGNPLASMGPSWVESPSRTDERLVWRALPAVAPSAIQDAVPVQAPGANGSIW